MECHSLGKIILLSIFLLRSTRADSCLHLEQDLCPSPEQEICNIRNLLIPQPLWSYFLGKLCFNYTHYKRLKKKYNITSVSLPCNDITVKIPAVLNSNNASIPLHPLCEKHLKPLFVSDRFYQLWEECVADGTECCSHHTKDDTDETWIGCPAIWDGWNCFPKTRPGAVVRQQCSKEAYASGQVECKLECEKECYSNATWNLITNEHPCAIAPVYRTRHNFRSKTLLVGAILTLPAIIIFVSFEKFRRTTRIILHRNLLIAIFVRYLLSIWVTEVLLLPSIDDASVVTDNTIACRVLYFFTSLLQNAIFPCMLLDSFYLHKVIVRTFANEPNLLYMHLATIVLTLIPTFAWTTVKTVRESGSCWLVDDSGDQWITDGFRITILIINTIILFDIIRVMIVKMKQGSVLRHTRATFRATLFLVPLFGIPLLIFSNSSMVADKSCLEANIFYFSSYINEALQGTMVALLFCYLNAEVHNEFRNLYRKLDLYLNAKFDITIRWGERGERKVTTTSYVGPVQQHVRHLNETKSVDDYEDH